MRNLRSAQTMKKTLAIAAIIALTVMPFVAPSVEATTYTNTWRTRQIQRTACQSLARAQRGIDPNARVAYNDMTIGYRLSSLSRNLNVTVLYHDIFNNSRPNEYTLIGGRLDVYNNTSTGTVRVISLDVTPIDDDSYNDFYLTNAQLNQIQAAVLGCNQTR
jgi:hypothetical protein